MAIDSEGAVGKGSELERLIQTLNGVVSELRELTSGFTKVVSEQRLNQRAMFEHVKRKMFASRLRSQIYELCDSKHSVRDISEELGKPGPLVTRYLREMEKIGFVSSVQEGKKKFYYKVK